MAARLLTVVETASFRARAKGILTESEVTDLISMIAASPTCGVIMPGTGGIRKVRIALGSRGKSGGARVIYYYHNAAIPAFLLTVFRKNEKANLSAAERVVLADLTKVLVETYRRKKR